MIGMGLKKGLCNSTDLNKIALWRKIAKHAIFFPSMIIDNMYGMGFVTPKRFVPLPSCHDNIE